MSKHLLLADDSPVTYIAFEGMDNSGKSSAVEVVEQWINKHTHTEVVKVREPGGSALAETIRDIVTYKTEPLDELTLTFLYMAGRANNMSNVIAPAIEAGKIVLSDRSYVSGMAYQRDHGRNPALIDLITRVHKPDIIFYIDVDLQTISDRATDAPFERSDRNELLLRQSVYRTYVKDNPQQCIQIDGNRPIEVVQGEIISYLESLLG